MPTLGQPELFLQAKEGLFDDAGNIGAGSKQFFTELDGQVRRLGQKAHALTPLRQHPTLKNEGDDLLKAFTGLEV